MANPARFEAGFFAFLGLRCLYNAGWSLDYGGAPLYRAGVGMMGRTEAGVIGVVLTLSLAILLSMSWTGPTQAESPYLIAHDDGGTKGCTPGFWKNHTDAWVGFLPSQTLEDVFDVPDSLGLDSTTLLQALSFGGGPGFAGGARTLLRDAVAALLNSAHPDVSGGFPYTTGQVISLTNAALATGNRTAALNQASAFNSANNLGCPIR